MMDLPDRLTINGIEYVKVDGEPKPDVDFKNAILRCYRIGQKEIVGSDHTFSQKESGMSLWATDIDHDLASWIVPPLDWGTEIIVHNVTKVGAIKLIDLALKGVRLMGERTIGPGTSVVLVWGPAKIVKVIGPNVVRSK